MRRCTSTSNGAFLQWLYSAFFSQVSWCTFFGAYNLLSGLSRNHLFYSMSFPESDLVSCEWDLPMKGSFHLSTMGKVYMQY